MAGSGQPQVRGDKWFGGDSPVRVDVLPLQHSVRMPAGTSDEGVRTASKRLRNGHLVLRTWTRRDLLKPLNWEFVGSFRKIDHPIRHVIIFHIIS